MGLAGGIAWLRKHVDTGLEGDENGKSSEWIECEAIYLSRSAVRGSQYMTGQKRPVGPSGQEKACLIARATVNSSG